MSARLLVLTTLFALLALAACGGDNAASLDARDDHDGPSIDGGDGTPDARTPDAGFSPDAGPSMDVQCDTLLTSAAEGSCDVVDGTGTAVVIRGNILGDGAALLDGTVMYDGEQIACVGCDCSDEPGYATATVITCAGAAVSPGLINAHSHLNYENAAPLASTAPGGTRYNHRHGWRGGVPTPSNAFGTGATSNGMRWNELRHLLSGTTSIAASTKANALVRNLDELEAADTALGFAPVTYEVFTLGDSNETFKANCAWNYEYSEFEVSQLPGMVTHTAEGIDNYAHDEFRCQSQSFNGGEDFVEKNVGHIHGVGLNATDYYNMARDDAKLVWSPRSNLSLYGMTAQAQVFDRLGGTIALGTDWTYSGSANLVREMACIDQYDTGWLGGVFTDEDLWRMATINGAKATGTDALIGSLVGGKVADIAIYHAEAGQLHRAVITANTDDVVLVVKAGRPMFGEADVLTALDASCEALDVCGSPRRVCASRELGGTTFATLAAAVSGGATPAYPAIFCGVPANEPTCIPTRTEYNGVTTGDVDGDGVANGADDCPTMFNPIRPMDGTVQADVDGDGAGDACDPTPVGTDIDADTVTNSSDVCPFVADLAQVDMDSDDKGDVCDACPTSPNPDSVCAPAPVDIVAINTTLPEGSTVSVVGAVVTGIGAKGFAIQDPAVTSGVNAGVWVYTGSAPAVALGDRVTVSGVTDEYFTMTEISAATIDARVAGTPLAPIPLTVAQASTEPYEGVLVQLTDVTSVTIPYACLGDEATCTDTLLWQLNGGTGILAWDECYAGSTSEWTAEGAGLTSGEPINGVMFYRYNRRRLMPRLAGDIGN